MTTATRPPKIEKLRSLLEKISHESSSSPGQKLARLKKEVLPKIESMMQPGMMTEWEQDELGNLMGGALRGIAISANNTFHQPALSIETINLALRYARDPRLVSMLDRELQMVQPNIGVKPPVLVPQNEDEDASASWAKKFFKGSSVLVGVVVVLGAKAILRETGILHPHEKQPPAQISSYGQLPPTAYPSLDDIIKTTPQTPVLTPPPREEDEIIRPSTPTVPVSKPLPDRLANLPPLTPTPFLPRTWKNREAKEIVAKLMEYDGTHVTLETEDGKTHRYPLSGLSDPSQALALKVARQDGLLPAPKALPLPVTGRIKGPSYSTTNTGPLTVETQEGYHYYFKLVDTASGSTRMIFFIRGGDTLSKVHIPAGNYSVRHASGTTWYGEEHLFGENTVYTKLDSDFVFGDGGGYTITLKKQIGGNLKSTEMDENSF